MKLKIIYRSAVIWNVILHIIMTCAFVLLQEAIYQENSVFNPIFVKNVAMDLLPIIILAATALVFVFNLKKISAYFYLLSVLLVFSYTSYNLANDFSKLILIVLFIYVLTSYYLFFFLKTELQQSYFNPGFTDENLFEPMLFKINANLVDKINNKKYPGILTNWDEEGCFIKLSHPIEKIKKLELEVVYLGHSFKQKVRAVTVLKDKNGLGLRLDRSDKSSDQWKDIYKIISDRGMKVEFVQ